VQVICASVTDSHLLLTQLHGRFDRPAPAARPRKPICRGCAARNSVSELRRERTCSPCRSQRVQLSTARQVRGRHASRRLSPKTLRRASKHLRLFLCHTTSSQGRAARHGSAAHQGDACRCQHWPGRHWRVLVRVRHPLPGPHDGCALIILWLNTPQTLTDACAPACRAACQWPR